MLFELASSILVLAELLLHLYVVAFDDALFLLHLILSVDPVEPLLVRLIVSTASVDHD